MKEEQLMKKYPENLVWENFFSIVKNFAIGTLFLFLFSILIFYSWLYYIEETIFWIKYLSGPGILKRKIR